MTCQELRLYFEDRLRADAEFRAEAEHLAHCPECAQFVESRRQLGAALRQLREIAPEPSSTLDATILANYRRQIATDSSVLPISKAPRVAVVRWSAVAAALALAATLLLHSARKPDYVTSKTRSRPQAPIAEPIARTDVASEAPATHIPASGKTRHPRVHRPAAQANQPPAPPEEFRSLMYCDPLSCGGAMQVIRVQLPPATAFEPPTASANESIYADVLVGPDGVARGIRVVQ